MGRACGGMPPSLPFCMYGIFRFAWAHLFVKKYYPFGMCFWFELYALCEIHMTGRGTSEVLINNTRIVIGNQPVCSGVNVTVSLRTQHACFIGYVLWTFIRAAVSLVIRFWNAWYPGTQIYAVVWTVKPRRNIVACSAIRAWAMCFGAPIMT